MKQAYYRALPSGEMYVVALDDAEEVTAIRGPLHYREVTAAALGQWDMSEADPDDLDWYRDAEFALIEPTYPGDTD